MLAVTGNRVEGGLKLGDFLVWADVSEKPRPSEEAGAAFLALADKELLPGFAIGGPWVEPLMREGKEAQAPPRLCWAAVDAILLAPHRADAEHWGGFLIAEGGARGQTREFCDPISGELVCLTIPGDVIPRDAVATARANVTLAIASGKTEAREPSLPDAHHDS